MCGFLRVLALTLIVSMLTSGRATAQTSKRLSEADLTKLIELQIGDDAIVSKIRKDGSSVTADEPTFDRLRKAGASPAVIDALRPAKDSGSPTSPPLVSFNDLVDAIKQGADEPTILRRLAASPTRFTLGREQLAQLEALGASKAVLAAVQSRPIQAGAAGSDVTALAIILDCSGSMKERTPDGESKMDAAQRVLKRLIPAIPNGLDVTFILYGHDARRLCDAVEVVRPLKPLDDAGKQELLGLVAGLRPVGSTPIALALRTAGAELARSDGLSEIVLVTDGMETCQGQPANEAAMLIAKLNLKSVEVIGMGVSAAERTGLEGIAAAGKGHFYNTRNAQEIAAAFEKSLPVGQLNVEAPTLTMRAAAVSGVIVTPVTLKGFPAIAYVAVCKPGKGPIFGLVQRSDRPGQTMLVPPGNYELWYQTVGSVSDAVLIVKDIEVPAKQTVTVQTNRVVSAIVVNDLGLGVKVRRIQVFPAGNHFPGAVITNAGSTFGKPMLVAPDREYDVLVTPEGGEPVMVAEKVQPKPGELLTIGGEAGAPEGLGRLEAEPPAPGLAEAARAESNLKDLKPGAAPADNANPSSKSRPPKQVKQSGGVRTLSNVRTLGRVQTATADDR